MANGTLLETRQAEIKGKFVIVQVLKGKDENEIRYKVNGKEFDAAAFWTKKPIFHN
jgi:hypothetical protein